MTPPPRTRLARIMATVGPASFDARTVRAMVDAGMDVARLNMSHGDEAWHAQAARLVRAAARGARRPVGLMVDLQGPKVRLGRFASPLPVRPGDRVTLTVDAREAHPAAGILPVDWRPLVAEAEPGHELLLGDGTVRLRVEKVHDARVEARVLEGDAIEPRTGLFLPQATPRSTALSRKDRRDLALAVKLKADFVALSFVRRAQDVTDTRRAIERLGGDQLVIAKIETRQALENLDEILVACDGVLVARGDLGVTLPPERVPVEQKRILYRAAAAGKPSIIATQMLESMRHASRPTRAEASDVANAVLDGSWAVMLTAETASGEHPVEAVAMMARIVGEAEQMQRPPRRLSARHGVTVSEGLAEAGVALALDIGARRLVALTRSGATARLLARFPLAGGFVAYTPSPRTLTRLTLMRGAIPRPLPAQRDPERALARVEADLRHRGEVARGDVFVALSGSARDPQGSTSRLVVVRVR